MDYPEQLPAVDAIAQSALPDYLVEDAHYAEMARARLESIR